MLLLPQAEPVQAQALRTFVSGVGDDANPCLRTSPCKTFASAMSRTAINGEINCLDPGGFGAVTITKSLTIDCQEVFGSILHSGTNGITISFDLFNAQDTQKTVRLRNLKLNRVNAGLIGIRIIGGSTIVGGAVFIEDCLIDGNFCGAARGISEERTAGGKLFVSNATVRNMGQTGIQLNPISAAGAAVAGQRIDAVFDNVRVENANFGIAIGNNVRATINRSVFSGNTRAGIEVEGPLTAAQAHVSNSVSSNNGTGVQNGGGTVTIRLSSNDIVFNGTAFSGAAQSFNNNRVQGNDALGTAPTVIGSTSNPTGLQ